MTAPLSAARRNPRAARAAGPLTDTASQVDYFQGAAKAGTDAFAAGARDDLTRDVGKLLGNLNATGSLRSGGVQAGANELTRTFGKEIGRAGAQTALQAAALGQQEASGARDLEFRGREGAANRSSSEGIAQRGLESTERIAGADLGFREKQLGQQGEQFAQDLGFRKGELRSREEQAALERAQRLDLTNLDLASREKLAAAELEFKRQGLSSEEARAAAELDFRKNSFTEDLGFRRDESAKQQGQFDADLGFRRTEGEANRALTSQEMAERQRQFNVERADKLKAAEQQKKGGLFGFLGKALGFASNFIPGGGIVRSAVNTAAKVAAPGETAAFS